MAFEVSFSVTSKEHLIDALKVFWQSRGFVMTNSSSADELILLRGDESGTSFSLNPLKYKQLNKCKLLPNIDGTTQVNILIDLFKAKHVPILREVFIQEECKCCQSYLNDFTKGKPLYLKNINELSMQSSTFNQIFNIIFPGVSLLFIEEQLAKGLGMNFLFLNILGLVSYIKGDNNDSLFITIPSYIVLLGITSILLMYFTEKRNYQLLHKFNVENS